MTFQELLLKTRGFEWEPPERLVAIDPGETIGYSYFKDGHFQLAGQSTDLKDFINILTGYNPTVVAYEEYRIYSNKLSQHTLSKIPTLKVIGGIELVCDIKDYKKIAQLASTAKGFCTDLKLKEWGFYQSGKRHANDSIMHGCHALLFSKEL